MMRLKKATTYTEVYDSFNWKVPEFLNMGVEVCDKHAIRAPEQIALIVASPEENPVNYTFASVRTLSNRLANTLMAAGLGRGERIAILLPQSVETAVSHIAAWKMGSISIPLFTLFGEDALRFRLMDSGAKIMITNMEQYGKVESLLPELPNLKKVFIVDASMDDKDVCSFWADIEKASSAFKPVKTHAETPAFISYTSGTTGNPKGALHAHRTLIGHLPGVEFFHNFLPQAGDLMWTPADWAWIGGLMNCLIGSWHYGVTNLAYRARKYDPEEALALIERFEIRNTFMPPTALKVMREVPKIDRFNIKLRTVAVAGEPMGSELLEWGRQRLNVTFNEFYGQTECNLVLANNSECMKIKPGSMGKSVPGHRVAVISPDGKELAPGSVGQIAVKAPDPVMLLEYWNNKEASDEKIINGWWEMGDQGTMDDEGYFWFVGRDDDVITSSGYRIGPGEIEDCLTRHPAVSLAAAIGVPDPTRTELIKVFIRLMPGYSGSVQLEEEIRNFVKNRLSPHEYPRIIQFVDTLPLTSTGKIKRKELRDAELK